MNVLLKVPEASCPNVFPVLPAHFVHAFQCFWRPIKMRTYPIADFGQSRQARGTWLTDQMDFF